MKSTLQKDLVMQTISEFPNAGSRTIADVLVQRHPALFKDIDSARSNVRYYRGNMGKAKRALRAGSALVRPNGTAGKSFPDLPDGIAHFENWGALEIAGDAHALVLADLHIPFHDKQAIELAVAEGIRKGCDLVIVNGDGQDFYEFSRFQIDPRKCNFKGALETGRQFNEWLRSKFPKARIIYTPGNHGEHLERYFATRAPAVIGVDTFELKALLDFATHGIEFLGEKRPMKLGKLHVLHGHEIGGGSTSVNAARGLFLRAKVHALCGHWHQSSQHSERALDGTVISTFSTGCLCDLHPAYAVHNNWSLGAATVEVAKDGHFRVNNFKIIDGEIY